jgi:molybdopterin molybdotransferase
LILPDGPAAALPRQADFFRCGGNVVPTPAIAQADGEACLAGRGGALLTVDMAGRKAVAAARVVREVESLPLFDAIDRVCAARVEASIDIPPFANSAMDGYAVSCADLAGNTPCRLPLGGRLAAGDAAIGAGAGTGSAIRILTGAPVPAFCDAVVMQEDCSVRDGQVAFQASPKPGQNIRLAGEDVRRGSALVGAGEMLTPPRLALLAAAGVASVPVRRRLRVGLLSTGNELREPGDALRSGQIYNSNRYFLRAALRREWIELRDFGIVTDDAGAIRDLLRTACAACDIVLTTGGVSAGDADHLFAVLHDANAELSVLKVAMRPGKPVTVARLGATLVIGLPGNPFAAAVTFRQIALPAIRAGAGLGEVWPQRFAAVSGFCYPHKPGRTEFVPVTWSTRDETGRPVLTMLGRGSSASLSPFACARAMAILTADAGGIVPGMPLDIELLCE